jgi:hypothetical protein
MIDFFDPNPSNYSFFFAVRLPYTHSIDKQAHTGEQS